MQPQVKNTQQEKITSIRQGVYDLRSYDKRAEGRHDCIVINLAIIFAENVNFATNNHFHTFAPTPTALTKSWLRAWLRSVDFLLKKFDEVQFTMMCILIIFLSFSFRDIGCQTAFRSGRAKQKVSYKILRLTVRDTPLLLNEVAAGYQAVRSTG